MPLESCMILLDNSEYMRNGDYVPTRLEAQHDAANLLVNAKTQSNPESTVGVIAMSGTTGSGPGRGGTGAELLVSPTDDMGKILAALHGVPTRGPGDSASSGVDIPASVQVASLALKHRRNKNGAQRVVVFVGSPLDGSVEARALQRAGRQLKKNNVAIDVICMGEHETNEGRLQELVDAANGTGDGGERTCNLVTIPAGVLPSDVLVSSPIIGGGGGGGGGGGMPGSPGGAAGGSGGGADAFAEYGGVDPNMDPELAMALRVSMEEERARQERAAAAAATEAPPASAEGGAEESKDGGEEAKQEGMEVDADGKPAADAAAASAPSGGADAMDPAAMMMGGADDEDALLQQALAMSMAESYAPPAAGGGAEEGGVKKEEEGESKPAAAAEAAPMEMDEDAEMAMALAMSMQQDGGAGGGGGGGAEFQDPAFVNQLLGSLPGVDPNDPDIQNALKNAKKDGDDDNKDGDDKK